MRDAALWRRLQAHAFDAPGGTQPYSVKLALAEGWDADYTAQVIEEYRRFIYLTQVSDGQVTPSIVVDRAWHMHLTFTRNYWEVLCPQVLGRALHHEPCAGPEEMPRYHRQFDQTRELYEAEFGTPPPVHVWGNAPQPQQPLAQPPKRLAYAGLYGISAGVILLFLEGGTAALFLLFFGVVIYSIFWARPKKRKHRNRDSPTMGTGGCGGCGSGGRSSKGDSSPDGGGDAGGGCGGGGCGGGGG